MLLMFEKGIGGAKDKNKYMIEQYNLDETSAYLQHLDVNNLYGWV